MFQMPVIEVPTNLPNIRVDLPIQSFAVRHHICVFHFSVENSFKRSNFFFFSSQNELCFEFCIFSDC